MEKNSRLESDSPTSRRFPASQNISSDFPFLAKVLHNIGGDPLKPTQYPAFKDTRCLNPSLSVQIMRKSVVVTNPMWNSPITFRKLSSV